MNALQKFNSNWEPVTESGCWLWTGGVSGSGYGRFQFAGKRHFAHRFSYETHVAPLGDLDCCHTCDTPACVNPSHLFAGTAKENIHDCMRKGRFSKALGSANGKSRLTEEEVRAIAVSNGSTTAVGKRFGISAVTVSKIRNKKTWRHIW